MNIYSQALSTPTKESADILAILSYNDVLNGKHFKLSVDKMLIIWKMCICFYKSCSSPTDAYCISGISGVVSFVTMLVELVVAKTVSNLAQKKYLLLAGACCCTSIDSPQSVSFYFQYCLPARLHHSWKPLLLPTETLLGSPLIWYFRNMISTSLRRTCTA